MQPWVTQTLNTEKPFETANVFFLDSAFDRRLRLLAVCVIKQNGILWKPFLWCHRHLSKTLDVCERETEFDSSDISLNHIAGYAAVLPPEEVSPLIHPLCNKLTAHTVNMLPDPPDCFDRLIVYCVHVYFQQLQQEKQKSFLGCVWLEMQDIL